MKPPRTKPPSAGKVRLKPPTVDIWTVKEEPKRFRFYCGQGFAIIHGIGLIDLETRTIHVGDDVDTIDIAAMFNDAVQISREDHKRATFRGDDEKPIRI